MTRLGSLCSGYGGLELGVMDAIGGDVAWHAETDPAASSVLDRHWPGVPNHGDITAVDWAGVEPVDVLCAGFPCQPVSMAGRRKVSDDARWLWPHVAHAVRVLRPRHVIVENVSGLLVPWRDGRRWGPAPVEEVAGDLAALGYVGRWRSVRASDVGAPHRRERVFIVAADTDRRRREGLQASRAPGGETGRATTATVRRRAVGRGAASAHPDRQRLQGRTQPHEPPVESELAAPRRDDPDRLGSPAPDATGLGLQDESLGGNTTRQHERPIDRASRRDRPRVPAEGVRELGRTPAVVAWGAYGPAIARWERTLGRRAPAPTDAAGRLSPRFVEWTMGLPDGWVTGTPGVTRTAALRVLGNGVVPQQAACAVAAQWEQAA